MNKEKDVQFKGQDDTIIFTTKIGHTYLTSFITLPPNTHFLNRKSAKWGFVADLMGEMLERHTQNIAEHALSVGLHEMGITKKQETPELINKQ